MALHTSAVVLGLDVGTGGVRVVAAVPNGTVLAEAQTALSDRRDRHLIHEQDPTEWWSGVCSALGRVIGSLDKAASFVDIKGIAVTSTSGSLVLADSSGQPVRPAMLYDDARGATIAEEINRKLPPEVPRLNSSYSLVKVAWVRLEEPSVWRRARHVLHPADWITGKLTGQFGSSDDSNALKLGYDAEARCWNRAVSVMDMPTEIFPKVVQPGQPIGTVCRRASHETGLRAGTPVFAGATDGMTGLIASGAREPGQANTNLGTTIVWKALSRSRLKASPGIYCHRHPSGLWAPGAASNSGPGSLHSTAHGGATSELDCIASKHLPTNRVCYLLSSKGERFPFLNKDAKGFFEGTPASSEEAYAAQLQSLAFVERWGFERLEACGVTIGKEIFTTGNAGASPTLMQLRASVLKREVKRCRHPTSAFGAATLAACRPIYGGDIISAIQSMTQLSARFQPEIVRTGQYEEIYRSFRAACTRRGYE